MRPSEATFACIQLEGIKTTIFMSNVHISHI